MLWYVSKEWHYCQQSASCEQFASNHVFYGCSKLVVSLNYDNVSSAFFLQGMQSADHRHGSGDRYESTFWADTKTQGGRAASWMVSAVLSCLDKVLTSLMPSALEGMCWNKPIQTCKRELDLRLEKSTEPRAFLTLCSLEKSKAMCLMIHAADVNHPTKPWHLHYRYAQAVCSTPPVYWHVFFWKDSFHQQSGCGSAAFIGTSALLPVFRNWACECKVGTSRFKLPGCGSSVSECNAAPNTTSPTYPIWLEIEKLGMKV